MDSLDENNVYRIQLGRTLDEDEQVNDVINIGLQHLSEGTKNPLREFNTAFKSLQKRRQMKPVSKLAEEYLNKPVSSPPLHSPSETPTSASSESVPPRSSTPETMIAQRPVTEGEAESDDVDGPSELETILDSLVNGDVEPTLPRLTEDDVSLDMDKVEVEVEAESEESDWETDEDKGSEESEEEWSTEGNVE